MMRREVGFCLEIDGLFRLAFAVFEDVSLGQLIRPGGLGLFAASFNFSLLLLSPSQSALSPRLEIHLYLLIEPVYSLSLNLRTRHLPG